MTTRHSTSKRYTRLPCRDATEQNKAKMSPWTLSRAASAQAGHPRTARHKATRETRAKALKRGTARRKHQLPSSRRHRHPGPPSARRHVLSFRQTKRCAPRSTPPTGVLPRPVYCHIRRAGAQACQGGVRHRLIPSKARNRRNHSLAESHDSTKASGATVGYHN